MDPNFPLNQWDRLLEQGNITLNLLRASRSNPNLSAYAFIHGNFNFQATPLAPTGTKVVAHVKPDARGSWELNGEPGWYVGPALQHYRCVTCYFPKSRSQRVCDTVTFIPTVLPFLQVTITDHLKQAATDIVTILTSPPSTTVPSLKAGDPTQNALLELATQLQQIEPIPAESATQPPPSNPTIIQQPTKETTLPRVKEGLPRVEKGLPRVKEGFPTAPKGKINESNTTESLLRRSRLPKNCGFNNQQEHRYPLRSQRKLGTNFRAAAADYLLAQHIFQTHIEPAIHHVYKKDGLNHD